MNSLTPTVLPDWQHLHPRLVAQSYIAVAHAPSVVRSCAPHNLCALYRECSPPRTIEYSSHLSTYNFQSRVARRLFSSRINAATDEKLFFAVIIKKTKPADAAERLRQCAVYEITIKDLNRAFLAEVAADGHLSLRDYLRSRIVAVKQPMADMYAAALVACDVDACELCTRSLAADETTSLAYRFRVRCRRAAREIGDILIAQYEERVYGSRPLSEYVQVGDGVFTPSAVRVPLVPPPLPPLRTSHASPGLQPPLASLFSTGERLHFASSTLSTSAQLASSPLHSAGPRR